MTLRYLLPAALLALGLTACSEPADEHAAGGHDMAAAGDAHDMHSGHHAMDAADDGDSLAPLPDDGVMPVIDVQFAWIRPHPEGRDVTAAYFAARLSEGAADRLTGARIDGAGSIELHGHTMNAEGMMQMHPIGPQDVTDTAPLVFTPGGRHLMVFGLAPVHEGGQVNGVLIFERAGEVPVVFDVRSMPPGLPEE